MANRYVRLYNGPEQSNIIGFSASAVPPESAGLNEFFTERGYEVHEYDPWGDASEKVNPRDSEVIRELGGVSFKYLGVQPPLKDEHIPAFAAWCRQNVDPYHNSGLLIDDRNTPSPIEPFSYSRRDVIAEW